MDSLYEGILACDEQGHITLINRTLRQFHGVDRIGNSPNEWREKLILYTSDGEGELRGEDHPLMRALAGEVIERMEVLVRDGQSQARYCSVNARPIDTGSGQQPGAIMVMHDISDSRRVEQEVLRLASIVDGSTDAIIGMNLDGIVVSWNKAATQLHGIKPEAAIGLPASVFGHLDDVNQIGNVVRAILSGETFQPVEQLLSRPDSDPAILSLRFSPIKNVTGQIIGISAMATDITHRKKAEEDLIESQARLQEANRMLESLASLDGLTGLKNRRTFDIRLNEEFERSVRHKQDLSILLIDIDNFKSFNDSFGHQAGDDVLRKIAKLLIHSTRDTDIVARYGGEEICVILPNTNSVDSYHISERLRLNIVEHPWEHRQVTVSVGISTLTSTITSQTELVRKADQALYYSKKSGRNRVTVSEQLLGQSHTD